MGEVMDKGLECYRRYLDGDEAGFECLIDLYRENLIFFLLRFLPTVEDAEDAAEDAFVELLLHRFTVGRGASLKTYLFTIGRNKALNMLKRQRRHGDIAALESHPDSDALTLEEHLCKAEERRVMLHTIDALPKDYREVLHLLYFEGLTLDECALVMKKRKKQIENLSYRARQALKERLGKEALFNENK